MGRSMVPARCAVTGGSGLVGRRLVEMLAERGAEAVVSFDVAPKPKGAKDAIGGCAIEYANKHTHHLFLLLSLAL